MMKYFYWVGIVMVFVLAGGSLTAPDDVAAASAEEINRDVSTSLQKLYAQSPAAKALGEKATGILVFPEIVKGGFIVGGKYGEGALLRKGKTVGYYNAVQVSYGLQAGLQTYGYALFFMKNESIKWLDKSDGWELGVGPTVVVVDVGAATSTSTTTAQSDIYAFFFSQQGLMGGLGLQGTKITKVKK